MKIEIITIVSFSLIIRINKDWWLSLGWTKSRLDKALHFCFNPLVLLIKSCKRGKKYYAEASDCDFALYRFVCNCPAPEPSSMGQRRSRHGRPSLQAGPGTPRHVQAYCRLHFSKTRRPGGAQI